MHGGHIKVKSSLNKGSTFVVHLAVETKKTKPMTKTNTINILLVEDDPNLLMVLQDFWS